MWMWTEAITEMAKGTKMQMEMRMRTMLTRRRYLKRLL